MLRLAVYLSAVKKSSHTYIKEFDPQVVVISPEYDESLRTFDAGINNLSFNQFLTTDAIKYLSSGDGVTYLVFNNIGTSKDLVAYYTLSSGAIPYVERWAIPEDERTSPDKKYDEYQCGISTIEIKMFAVSTKYQDVFYRFEGEDLPVAAWILRSIIDQANEMMQHNLGIKAIFLQSVPDAIEFYQLNKFEKIYEYMNPFSTIDSDDLTPMFLALVNLDLHYDS